MPAAGVVATDLVAEEDPNGGLVLHAREHDLGRELLELRPEKRRRSFRENPRSGHSVVVVGECSCVSHSQPLSSPTPRLYTPVAGISMSDGMPCAKNSSQVAPEEIARLSHSCWAVTLLPSARHARGGQSGPKLSTRQRLTDESSIHSLCVIDR